MKDEAVNEVSTVEAAATFNKETEKALENFPKKMGKCDELKISEKNLKSVGKDELEIRRQSFKVMKMTNDSIQISSKEEQEESKSMPNLNTKKELSINSSFKDIHIHTDISDDDIHPQE